MKRNILLTVFFALWSLFSFALVTLPSIFCDNMVLQQNTTVKIWGWAKPFEEITVTTSWNKKSYKVTTNNTMTWSVDVSTPEGSFTPYEITVEGWRKLTIKNVLIGEVWLCSGQSNMEWSPRNGIMNGDQEIAAAQYPNIRFFQVVPRKSEFPQDDLYGEWKPCSPETMIDFSSIGYFFARDLLKELNVPIGMIGSYVGGSPIETWMPMDGGKVYVEESAKLLPEVPWSPSTPGCLYNAMIAPITQFKIKGFLWYQGEANEPNAEYYLANLQDMIWSWRKHWINSTGERWNQMPFYFAQISPYNYGTKEACPKIQYAQLYVPNQVAHSAMVVTSDVVDDVNNIHPKDKLTVAHRFANIAISETYGRKMDQNKLFCPYSVDAYKMDKGVFLIFKNAKDLRSTTKKIEGFEVVGDNGVWYPAKATIVKNEETGTYNRVNLYCSKVKEPKMVSYAWSNTALPSLRNEYDLPASCFIIDEVRNGEDVYREDVYTPMLHGEE
ncbi:MAG: hypothetical protein IKJ98_05675 [Bacteroidales bacterium]|nr:hypothetical protein [Bacteroidales bacterium]